MDGPTLSLQARNRHQSFLELSSALKEFPPDHYTRIGVDLEATRLATDDARARFKAWGTNIAAFHYSNMRTSLDFRLKEAPGIASRASQILADLQEYVSETISIVSGQTKNETINLADLSDSSDDSEEEERDHEGKYTYTEVGISSLQERLRAIDASISSLMKLSILIRSSATRDDYVKAVSRYNNWNPYPDIGHVREKYGKARYSQPWLLERLGKAITRRRQFLKYRFEHHEKMSQEMPQETQDEIEKPKNPEKIERTVASTKATTFVGYNKIVSEGPKAASETGESFTSLTSYDPTVFGKDGASTLLTVPPPPEMAFPDVRFNYGDPFQCPYCFTEQIVKNKLAWKRHVFQDLKPYICTFKGCEMAMFKSRNEWFAHELKSHRRQWRCQFCEHKPFSKKYLFSKHLKSAHGFIIESSSLEALIILSEEQVERIPTTACCLCDDWEEDLRRVCRDRNSQLPQISSDMPSGHPKQFRRHLGRHMEQLALFALPHNVDDVDLEDDSSEDENSQPDDDDKSLLMDVLGDDLEAIEEEKPLEVESAELDKNPGSLDASDTRGETLVNDAFDKEDLTLEAFHLLDRGNSSQAAEIFRQVFLHELKLNGKEHPDTLRSMDELVSALEAEGKYDEAEQLLREILQTRQKVVGNRHPNTLSSMDRLAECIRDKPKDIEAEQLLKEALQIRREIFGMNYQETFTSIDRLAAFMLYHGRYNEAESLLQEAFQIRQKAFGKHDPSTLESMNRVAGVLCDQDRYPEAEKLYRERLLLRQEVLGKEDTNICIDMDRLAAVMRHQGKLSAAEPLLQESLQIQQKFFGKNHPATLESLNRVAEVLYDQGKYHEAEELYRERLLLMQKELGKTHPEIAIAMGRFAALLEMQGKYDEAEHLRRESLQILQVWHGKEHPNTLECMRDLALLLENQGKVDEAEPLMQEMRRLSANVLGDEDALLIGSWRGRHVAESASAADELTQRVLDDEFLGREEASAARPVLGDHMREDEDFNFH